MFKHYTNDLLQNASVYKTHFVIDLYAAYKKLCFRIMNIDLYLFIYLLTYLFGQQTFRSQHL